MKLSKIFFGLATAAMFAACSSDELVEQKPQVNWNEDGTGYMALNITMPTAVSTRGNQNDQFDKGEAAEYKVNDVTLVLFDGTTFHSAYDITNDWDGTGKDGNVTADNKFIAKVEGGTITAPKAFVVLNRNNVFTIDEVKHGLIVNGTALVKGTSTLADLQKLYGATLDLQATAFHNAANNFLMMNAPLNAKPGGPNTIATEAEGAAYVLAEVPTGGIYATAAAAAAGDKVTHVYVERAVGKVTLKEGTTVTTPDAWDAATVDSWTLDNTNTDSYICRATDGFSAWSILHNDAAADVYRFVGSNTVKHGIITQGTADEADAYRTYFAKDPNFDAAGTFNTVIDKTTGAWTADPTKKALPMYCAENTFDVEHMIYKETTRALVKVIITPKGGTAGDDFYSRPGDDKIYAKTAIVTAAENRAKALIAAAPSSDFTGTPVVAYDGTASTDRKFVVKATGTYTGSDPVLTDMFSATGKTFTVAQLGYQFYKGGVVYYDARIGHFLQEGTPWTAHDAMTIDQSYKLEADGVTPITNFTERFLGRWGVLRNNWYELEIGGIMKMGYSKPIDLDLNPGTFDPENPGDPDDPTNPEWPEDPNTPDDNQKAEQWISVDVNILSWAKRFQPVVW